MLLHTCCGPCTTYVNKWLCENGFDVKGYFYNPNIRPQAEYERRLLTMEHYAAAVGLKVAYEINDVQLIPKDCQNCYQVRLEKTAQFAKQQGIELFTTTLLISPYQNHVLIKDVGEKIAQDYGISFLYQDFSTGYSQSRQMSQAMKLFRQNYCGCTPRTSIKLVRGGKYVKVN
ncbi:MAG: epoxyqueuosine reductase QueH [Candidatus Margulisbacteria bacterium]|nr:epoxyqueuosine reductase QueH [Candidatus Margulisiibacteriota bacterium]